jgi:hypothetical protein
MSDSAETELTFSVLTCQQEQLCRDFDFHTEQLSAENHPNFRRIQTGLLCRARSNIFIRDHKRKVESTFTKNINEEVFLPYSK